jgi:serine protease
MPALSAPGDTARVWVQYRPGQQVAVQRTLEQAGAQFHYTFPQLDSHVVTLPSTALPGIANNPNVVAVEDDVPRELLADAPAEAYAQALATLTANGQTMPYGIKSVQAPRVWPTTTGGGRTVCIVDSGLYTGHEDIAVSANGYSQVGTPWNTDGCGHGTHVAGTIAAANNDLWAWSASARASRCTSSRFLAMTARGPISSDLIDATNRCANAGADIISMSLGGKPHRTAVGAQRQFNSAL